MRSLARRWLITRRSRGIGRALAEAVLEAGHRFVAIARDPQQLQDVSDRYGQSVRVAPVDITVVNPLPAPSVGADQGADPDIAEANWHVVVLQLHRHVRIMHNPPRQRMVHSRAE